MSHPLLSIKNLTVEYHHDKMSVPAVRQTTLEIKKGETLGLVGESGCGKSTLALSIMGLLPEGDSFIRSGEIHFGERNLLTNNFEEWRTIRGRKISMVFQDPFSSLNPVLTIEYQMTETLTGRKADKKQKARELLTQVQLPDPERILNSYPHQLSGGQRQRILIAIALSQDPDLLIADEPTTALDVTIQDEILSLLDSLQKKRDMAMIFVTHNMGLVKKISQSLAVMYAGEIVEYGSTMDVLTHPKHPYTQGLLQCIPKISNRSEEIPVLDGQPPEPQNLPSGCSFHPRCIKKFDPCTQENPEERLVGNKKVRCHLYES